MNDGFAESSSLSHLFCFIVEISKFVEIVFSVFLSLVIFRIELKNQT